MAEIGDNMDILQEIKPIILEHNLELVNNKPDIFSIISPKELSDEIKEKIRKIVPSSMIVEYNVTIKSSTEYGLKVILVNSGVMVKDIILEKKTLKVYLKNNILPTMDPLIDYITQMLLADGFPEAWEVLGPDSHKHISLIKVALFKTKRNISISEDDIINLRILLNTTETVESFINNLN